MSCIHNVCIFYICIFYFRRERLSLVEIGDFTLHPFYLCDDINACIGGCNATLQCEHTRDPLSPVCAVCIDKYFSSSGLCYSCDRYKGAINLVTIYFSILMSTLFVIICGILYYALVLSRKVQNPPKTISEFAIVNISGNFAMSNKLFFSFLQILTVAFRTLHAQRSIIHSQNYLLWDPVMEFSYMAQCSNSYSRSGNSNPFFQTVALCTLAPIGFFMLLVCCSATVGKIFKYFNKEEIKFDFENGVELKNISSAIKTSTSSTKISVVQVFTDGIISRFVLLSPSHTTLWNTSWKLFFFFCFLSYPLFSATILSGLDCRDLGTAGRFVRVDYSVDCSSLAYSQFLCLIAFGILIVVFGFPFLFYTATKNRYNPLFEICSQHIHKYFKQEWRFFEVFNLLRKLTIVSLSQFVSSLTASRILFMLGIDMIALYIFTTTKPFANQSDQVLSEFFLLIECFVFLVFLIFVSNIDLMDNINAVILFETSLIVVLISIIFAPVISFGMKFESINDFCSSVFTTLIPVKYFRTNRPLSENANSQITELKSEHSNPMSNLNHN